uniref:EF-hand domain-containing protein n=1 Tax=Oncorhynchus tshawytscha TaxID=74940 RepID=A0AAZ3SXL1_ONCTS
MSVLSLESLCLADNDSPSSAEDLDLEDKWDTDLEVDEVKKPSKDTSTAEIYLQACKLVGVVPVSYFLRNLGTSTMNLNHHGLGPPGGKALAIALVVSLECSICSRNALYVQGMLYMFKERTLYMFKECSLCSNSNYRVKELDLSHNQFCGSGGEHLGQMLGRDLFTLYLTSLWLSSLMEYTGEALKFNNTLVYLDLNNNRITNEGVGMLCKGLEANDTLRALMVGLILSVFKDSARFEIGRTFERKKPVATALFISLKDYLDERKLRLWDFFRKIDKDGTMRVPVADFRKAVQQSNIPLDRYQIEELIQRLDRERTGMVDYRWAFIIRTNCQSGETIMGV